MENTPAPQGIYSAPQCTLAMPAAMYASLILLALMPTVVAFALMTTVPTLKM